MPVLIDTRTLIRRLLDHFRPEAAAFPGAPEAEASDPAHGAPSALPGDITLLTQSGGARPVRLGDVTPVGAKVVTEYVPRIGEVVVLFYRSESETASIAGEVIHLGASGDTPYFRIRFADATE